MKELLTSIKRLTEAHQKQTYQACIELAREMFEKMFFKNISQLIHSFPKNHVTECQRLFWSGLKRAPEPIVFDYREPLHMEFIKSTADIFASVFGVKPETDLAIVAQMTQKVSFPKFKPVWYVRSNRPKHDSETEGSG
ncbi:MAG: hypothetical protein JST59_02810 [Actinobacteria bacterium]|nr:hypothetical protein [Actinomycetota bacterium]